MTEEEKRTLANVEKNCQMTMERVKDIKYWLEGDTPRGFIGLIDRQRHTDEKAEEIKASFDEFKERHFRMMAKFKNIGLGIGVCLLLIALLLGYISLNDVIKTALPIFK
jgi:hypothetical protein